MENFGENLGKTVTNAARTAVYSGKVAIDSITTLYDVATGQTGDSGYFTSFMGKITAIQIEDQISRHPELMSVLNGHQEYNGQPISMEDRQRVAGDLAAICKNSGLEVNDVFFFGDSGAGMFGFYDPEGKGNLPIFSSSQK